MTTTTASAPSGPDVEQLLDAAERALDQLQTALRSDSAGWMENRVRSIARRVDRLHRRATAITVAHAGRFRHHELRHNRSDTTIATNLSQTAGCPKPDAYRRLGAAALDGTQIGEAIWDLRISVDQALAIAAACNKFEESLDPETIAHVTANAIARAGTTGAGTLQKDVTKALSALVPDDGEARSRHQRRQRAARLGRQGTDGMSDVILTVPPQGRALFEDASAMASKLRAQRAESARKAGEEPEEESYEQALHDHLMDLFSRGHAAHARAATESAPASSPSAATNHHVSGSAEDADTPADEMATSPASATARCTCDTDPGDPPVGSIVVRLGPADLANLGTFVSTDSGTMITVRDALEMAGAGPHFLVAEVDGGIRVFRIDEIDPDAKGRDLRFATSVQRMVLFALQDGCSFPGCREPATRCQVHHLDPWHSDGNTVLSNLTLACRAHHNYVNASSDGWTVVADPTAPNRVRWTPNNAARGSPRH